MDDQQQQNEIYDAPIEQADMYASSLAEGDHQVYLSNVLQAQIHLLAHKVVRNLYEMSINDHHDDLWIVLTTMWGKHPLIDK